jgi:hypothetical protein
MEARPTREVDVKKCGNRFGTGNMFVAAVSLPGCILIIPTN